MHLETEDIIRRIEDTQGYSIDLQEKESIELWRKGRDLQNLITHPGWPTVIEMLQKYSLDALQQLMEVKPGDDRVDAAHAVAYATTTLISNFNSDVNNAVLAAKGVPEVVKRVLHGVQTRTLETVL